MRDQIRRVEYQYATIPDRPGEGARVMDVFRQAGVNLLAFHAFPVGEGQAQLDLVPEDGEELRAAARDGGIDLSAPKTAFLATGPDRAGAMAELLATLGGAGVNVIAMDAVQVEGRYGSLFWVPADQVDRAAEVLGA